MLAHCQASRPQYTRLETCRKLVQIRPADQRKPVCINIKLLCADALLWMLSTIHGAARTGEEDNINLGRANGIGPTLTCVRDFADWWKGRGRSRHSAIRHASANRGVPPIKNGFPKMQDTEKTTAKVRSVPLAETHAAADGS